jgi:predicted metal-dependent TIM-barrel fold hydrolase
MAFIDPHVHADSRSLEDFVRLKAAGCSVLMAVAGPGGGFRSPDSILDHFRRLDQVDRRRIESCGIRAKIALGAHPKGIPESRLDEFLENWPQALSDHHAEAIGEIGLDKGTRQEKRVLLKGLQVARQTALPVIVHTPRTGKRQALDSILELVQKSNVDPQQVLLDHLTDDVLGQAAQSDCWLGLSVHPAKLKPAEAAHIVAKRGPFRFIIDSDMGTWPSTLFAIPATISAMHDLALPPETIRRVVHDNAQSLFAPNQT